MDTIGLLKAILLTPSLALAAFTASNVYGGELISGPMLGHQSHMEGQIWLETQGADLVEVFYREKGTIGPERVWRSENPVTNKAGVQPMLAILSLLEMGKTFEYRVVIDGVEQEFDYPLEFRTTEQWEWRSNDDPPDFAFLTGSCLYINDEPFDRPGTPYGKGTEILLHMADTGADFMLWSGDNVYLREADFSSETGIWYRFSHTRRTPDLQPLLATMPHYATWDDHEFGSNDANKSFEFKAVALEAFKTYFTNPTWGEPDNPGVYSKFFWGDAAFILMDNHYYRDDPRLDPAMFPDKTQFGARQVDWLKQSLLHIKDLGLYPYKFIVTGNQFLATVGAGNNSHHGYQRERNEILDFIRNHDIRGVVFVTGDVHHSGLYRQQIRPDQWVYEVTSSPLSSGSWNVEESDKAMDPAVVQGTLVGTQNFVQVELVGTKVDRKIRIKCIDKTNTERWAFTIDPVELGVVHDAD